MKILVTGATGFVGNYVVKHLLQHYTNTEIIATSTSRSKAEAYEWFNGVTFKEFNLNDPKGVIENYFDYFDRPDKLIHLAWEGLPNYKELFHFEKNLFAHYNFLKQLIEEGLNDITITGTCFEYGMQEGALSESAISAPSNPYALAKETLRNFLVELNKKKKFDLKWTRLFYMYGKGQSPNSLIPQLEKALEKGEQVFNMSGGEQLRDYLPIEKIGEYIVKIALQNEVTGIINCSSGTPVSVKDFVTEYLKGRNKNIRLNLGFYPYADFEPMNFWGKNEKLMKVIQK